MAEQQHHTRAGFDKPFDKPFDISGQAQPVAGAWTLFLEKFVFVNFASLYLLPIAHVAARVFTIFLI